MHDRPAAETFIETLRETAHCDLQEKADHDGQIHA
jgi:hypothetical protein